MPVWVSSTFLIVYLLLDPKKNHISSGLMAQMVGAVEHLQPPLSLLLRDKYDILSSCE